MWAFMAILLSGCSLMFNEQASETAKGSEYQVKFTSQAWTQKKDERSDYVLENKDDGRIMLSNSFCQEFQEQTLETLATKTFRTVTDFKTEKKEYTTFKGREAFRVEGTGSVDGVSVELRLLNTRRNNCYFDFFAITPTKVATKDHRDFENFLDAVEFK